MYLAVRQYDLSTGNHTNLTGEKCNFTDSVYVDKYSILRQSDVVTSCFPLKPFTRTDTHNVYCGTFFGFKSPENIRVIKCTRLVAIEENSNSIKGLIIVDYKAIPHIKYAITRFYKGGCVFEVGQSPVDKLLHPFSFEFLNGAIVAQFQDYLLERNNKSKGVFNLYVFLLCLYDKLIAKTYSILEEIVETNKQNIYFVSKIKETKRLIQDLVVQTCMLCNNDSTANNNSSNTKSRSVNPVLFLKCLFVQTYVDSDKTELVFDDTTSQPVFISETVMHMLVYERSLSVLELIKLMFPMYAVNRDGSVIYYERNKWSTMENRLEHLFVPNKISTVYKQYITDREEDDYAQDDTLGEPCKKISKKNKPKKEGKISFNDVISFWGRVSLIPFPSNVISFADSFVLIKNKYIPFCHTPLFRGMPSNLSWKRISHIIRHISQDGCSYAPVVNLLNSLNYNSSNSRADDGEEDVIDYFKYNYCQETGPELDPSTLSPCELINNSNNTLCPVFETLKYFLTVFSHDVELTFFMLWTLRFVLFGIPLKKCLIYYGLGNNGKTTFSNILRVLFGSSMSILSSETVSGNVATLCPDLYLAKNSKIVYADDLNKINANSLKQLVSGAFIFVRTLYQQGENVQMRALVTGSVNSLQIKVDYATMKRLLVIPFKKFFRDSASFYCNQEKHDELAEHILATLFWLERYPSETNIFYDTNMDVVYVPKSVKWYSHQSIWKNDYSSRFLNVLNIREIPTSFIRIDDLITEINLAKSCRQAPRNQIGSFFDDVEVIINLLKHRYETGKVLNKTKNVYESCIVGISIDKYKLLYDQAFELV